MQKILNDIDGETKQVLYNLQFERMRPANFLKTRGFRKVSFHSIVISIINIQQSQVQKNGNYNE